MKHSTTNGVNLFKTLGLAVSFLFVLITTVKSNTVADIIAGSDDHKTLLAAVTAANLVGTLSGDGPFTVFAPTDAAFAQIPSEAINALLADPSGELTNILLYHVVSATALSSSLTTGQVIKTVLGSNITITINDQGEVFINQAKVTTPDIVATNGVVHVIDAVLMPEYDITLSETENNGTIITDNAGKTLYFFTNDAFGTSACSGNCLNNWPIFYVESPVFPASFDASDFGSIDRGDGVMQTTFKGWPLYYFANDSEPGQTSGEGVGGRWFIAKPDYTIMLVDNQLVGNDGVNYNAAYTPGDEVVKYLVDDYGRTLYTWKNDRNNRNRFTNETFSNNGNWPIYEQEDVVIPSTLDADDFDVIMVHDRKQLTYKGWPLYFFGQDAARGQNKGVSVPTPGTWPVAVPAMDAAPAYTVVDIAIGSPAHTTLVTAVAAANLVETLQGEGPFTVFAPTNDAFNALEAGTLDALLADPSGALTDILLYHVVGAEALSGSLSNGQTIKTVYGREITVTINDQQEVFINGAKVIVADLVADNGVVHVIDAVLVPEFYPETVVDIIVGSDVHKTLAAAVTAAGLVATLQGEGPFTVFAPTDAAFDALPAGLVDDLLTDPTGDLTQILLYHVVGGKAMSSSLTNNQMVTTVQGQDVTVTINDKNEVFINGAQVIIADIEAKNGVVHVIDAVLVPDLRPETVVDIIVGSEVHKTLAAAVTAAGLVATLQGEGPFTVFAPTDAGFDALPAGLVDDLLADPTGDLTQILLYHVVGGKAMSSSLTDNQMVTTVQGQDVTVTINDQNEVFINGAQVIIADIEAKNGVVHVIDAVLVPDLRPETVVDIIVGSDVHKTLAAAVTAAGLVATLQGEGPFTVFAPTDAAFDALPAGLVDDLLADPTGDLTQILLYHVVGGKAMSSSLTDNQMVTTVQGQDVTVTINDQNEVFINGAQVIIADIEAKNGVVHVIDAVLVPDLRPETVVDIIVGSDVHKTLAAAVTAAGLVATLQGEGPFTVFAPTDAAFNALPAGLVDDLLADPTGALTDILLFHVVAANALSTGLSNNQQVTTVFGEDLTVTINSNNEVFLNGAQVIIADLVAKNGVVHVIDAVMVPTTPQC
jgi:uncharacterized surface protein with fasciclin (FAS1) repeats